MTTKPAAPQPKLIPLRGPSGKLYGMIDPERQTIEFKRGAQKETIHLRDYLQPK